MLCFLVVSNLMGLCVLAFWYATETQQFYLDKIKHRIRKMGNSKIGVEVFIWKTNEILALVFL